MNNQQTTINYTYDDANRLIQMGDTSYNWDENGNLLRDGVNTYTYDPANRLISVNDGHDIYTYTYNGLGDRLQQSVNDQTTNYTLDLNAGLTQVLDDGTNTYLYGVDRIAQVDGANTNYFLGDALGSVRQLADENAEITLGESYDPYGNVISSVGDGQSVYGYTGEIADQTGLTYLRARYYVSADGRFATRDTWEGNTSQPMSYNFWNYTDSNPINRVDPIGHCFTSSNPLKNDWSRFFEKPIGQRCASSSGQPSNQSTPTPTSSPTPKATCTPTVIPTPTPVLIPLGKWKITYYNIALETDFPKINPYNGTSDYVPVAGLQGTYRRQFIYSPLGIYGQGTGKSESGQYITLDWTKNNQLYGNNWPYDKNRPVSDLFYKSGKGGANGNLTAWETVAINQNEPQLIYDNTVMIDGYEQKFKVEDTGTFPDITHLDIFIGEVPHQQALDLGTKYLNVWKVIGN